jgi:hypothetical protein
MPSPLAFLALLAALTRPPTASAIQHSWTTAQAQMTLWGWTGGDFLDGPCKGTVCTQELEHASAFVDLIDRRKSKATWKSDEALAGQVEAAHPPNIVFILADDLGYGDISSYPNPSERRLLTPHVAALAKSGLQFSDAYAGYSVCAPSRRALMV